MKNSKHSKKVERIAQGHQCAHSYGLNCVPPQTHLTLVPRNMTLFGDKAFREAIRFSEAGRVGPDPV